jgi:3-deoxy-D-manno-octulosonic-acid transferase
MPATDPQPPHLRYRLLSLLLFPLWVLHAAWLALRHREPDYLWQRLGWHTPFRGGRRQGCIWVHAASVGEVNLILPLVERLRADHPVLVTTFTATGYRQARNRLPQSVLVRVLPIDFLPLSRLFFRRHRCRLGLIAETELWPETLYQARRAGTRLLQINARLSDKSLNIRPLWKPVLGRTLGCFDAHLARSEDDRLRLLALGAAAERIRVCGNLKYAAESPTEPPVALLDRRYLLFASTHDPEEVTFGRVMQALEWPLLAVIAPRHPQRGDAIRRQLEAEGWRVAQRSHGETPDQDSHIYLADTLGEMPQWMAHAELVVMGGSFAPVGGHNLLEPASLGRPVITGPSDHNIREELERLQAAGGLKQVPDSEALTRAIEEWLQQPQRAETAGRKAREALQQGRHILEDYLETIERYR